ncbi:MAG: sensor histidine kinase, partial [Clostridia bacterium]|nr:sensor histidine kinase [Clostridia bacterium]
DEQIRRSIMLLEPKWTEKETEFDVEMDCVTIYANDGLLFHVWNNLIDNAIKFSPNGGLITIRLTRTEQDVVFTIEDSGDGISEEAKKHIFDKFYQGDSSHKDNGNGLGLALVKKILSVTNGEIAVENLSPRGCKFTVRLPI